MAPMSRGKALSAARSKRSKASAKIDPSKNRHRFESFSNRIAALKIDPVRRGRQLHAVDKDDSSYFKTALDEWKELNLSANFTEFVQEITPYSQSLPQLLHHRDVVAELLLKYLAKADALSLEPLLALTTHFAHDLGARFEACFPQMVVQICNLAATHQEIEAIEWSFNCLAWLFKYLSKLLVPDLRPLYDLMSPLLGKTHQKYFVTRFAAEALSYLVRKASAAYERDSGPLELLIQHVFHDVSNSEGDRLLQHQQGLAVLFAESIIGVNQELTTSATSLLKALLLKSATYEEISDLEKPITVLERVLVSVIYQTSASAFSPLVDSIVSAVKLEDEDPNFVRCAISSRLLFVITGARNGTRIQNWDLIQAALIQIVEIVARSGRDQTTLISPFVVKALAVFLAVRPWKSTAQARKPVITAIRSMVAQAQFLEFCILVDKLNPQRFEEFVLPVFQDFVLNHWQQDQEKLCLAIRKISPSAQPASINLELPDAWQLQMKADVENISLVSVTDEALDRCIGRCNQYFDLLERFGASTVISESLNNHIAKMSLEALSHPKDDILHTFALGNAFNYVASQRCFQAIGHDIWPKVISCHSELYRLVPFLRTIQYLLEDTDMTPNEAVTDALLSRLINNLRAASSSLRLQTLHVLRTLLKNAQEALVDVVDFAIQIESGPFNLEHGRAHSMNIQKLASRFEENSSNRRLKGIVSNYCLGILYVPFTPLWEDACNALKTICGNKETEDDVLKQALSWIVSPVKPAENLAEGHASAQAPRASNSAASLGCSSLLNIESLVDQATFELEEAPQKLYKTFEEDHVIQPLINVTTREKGLRVLKNLPLASEKRSKQLVPLLLERAEAQVTSVDADAEENQETARSEHDLPKASSNKWSRKDLKSLLSLFAQFNNPKALYRSEDVYQALLSFLANGDSEIQSAAFKAICNWKSPSILQYRENLQNLLDDARFRDELAAFVHVNDAESIIQAPHQAQLMPVLLRLLYGRMIARTGAINKHGGQETKRKSILSALARFESLWLSEFVSIALGPLDTVNVLDATGNSLPLPASEVLSPRNQLGVLKVIQDLGTVLENKLHPFASRLINAAIFCAIAASHASDSNLLATSKVTQDTLSLSKTRRLEGLACLNVLYRTFMDFNWSAYETVIMEAMVCPRLPNLASENSQSVSNLLKLFSTWSELPSTRSLLVREPYCILDKLAECMIMPTAKEEVVLHILHSILANVLNVHSEPEQADSLVIDRLRSDLSRKLLRSVSVVLKAQQKQEIVQSCVQVTLSLTNFAHSVEDISALLDSAVYLLAQPSRRINPRLKGQVLLVIEGFTSQKGSEIGEEIERVYEMISSLFAFFKDNENRRRLVSIMKECAKVNAKYSRAAQICDDLNAFASSRLDSPDFDRRQEAFRSINETDTSSLSLLEWQVIVQNMLFFVKDNDEYIIRASASLSLKTFVKVANGADPESSALANFANTTLLPAMQKGLNEKSELVRAEYVSILSEIIKSEWNDFSDMSGLLGQDEESSFFNNILHIQTHRRIRALRKLCTEAPAVSGQNIARYCLPLVEIFLIEAGDAAEVDGNLAAEARNSLGVLAEHLEWQRFRSLLQKHTSDAAKFTTKNAIKTLGAVVHGLSHAWERKTIEGTSATQSTLSKTLPSHTQLCSMLNRLILPPLMDYVHFKDESPVELRILAAPTIVRIIMLLGDDDIAHKLPSVLMDVCNILKSKAQDDRDAARKTLADICAVIGPTYFGFVLKQLKASLQRGSQLHVLSYTIHSILVSVSAIFKPGDIDFCIPELMQVVIDDIFGRTGQEKDSEDYRSKMREVKKKNISFDSMELLASFTTLANVAGLVKPVQDQLEKPKVKVDKVDEIFRRLREGLRRNAVVNDQQFLVLCYEVLNSAYKDHEGHRVLRSPHSSKVASFAFDMLRRILDKHEVLKTASNLAGFQSLLELSLKQGDEDLQISAFRFLSSTVKVPLAALDENAGPYLRHARRLIEDAPSTNTPLAQTALRVVSALLRDRPNASINREQFGQDIAYLLGRIQPDLQEPARQGERERQVAAFNFMKAVLSRGILLKEIYDVMDTVREVMITNTEPPIPDAARSVYSRFLLEYFPDEGKGLSKQLNFLTSNLQYQQPRGRQSVMEVMHFLLTKKDAEAVQPLLAAFFLPLLVVLVTDEVDACRQSAALLVRKTFERASEQQRRAFTAQLKQWLDSDTDVLWQRVSLQCWRLYFEEHPNAAKETSLVLGHVSRIVAQESDAEAEHEDLTRDALNVLDKLCELFPEAAFTSANGELWSDVTLTLTSGSHQIVTLSSKLISALLGNLAKGNAARSNDYPRQLVFPLLGGSGYQLTSEKALHIAEASLQALQLDTDSTTTMRIIDNLAFIAKCSSAADETKPTLHSILVGAATVLRQESGEEELPARLAAIRLLTAVCKVVPADAIKGGLDDALMALYNLTDSSIPKPTFMNPTPKALQEELVTAAHDLLGELQNAFGASDFISSMQKVQEQVRERRDERRTKRRLEAVSAPEKSGRDKLRRHLSKRTRRKAKNAQAAGMRRGW